jgi:hypothetical protein
MNRMTWIGIIVWGICLSCIGLSAAGNDMQAQDMVFLILGGLISFLIGGIGLIGSMGGFQRQASEQEGCG